MYVIGVAESPLETERSGQRTCQVAKASRRGIFGMLAERVSQIGRTSTDDQGPGIGYLPKVPWWCYMTRWNLCGGIQIKFIGCPPLTNKVKVSLIRLILSHCTPSCWHYFNSTFVPSTFSIQVPTYLMVGRSATSSSPYEPGKGQWSPGGMEALVLPSAIVTLTIPAHGLTVYKIIWEFFRF